MYRTRAIITSGLYTFYPLFEIHLCTVTFGLVYGWYSRVISNQERIIVARVRYLIKMMSYNSSQVINVADKWHSIAQWFEIISEETLLFPCSGDFTNYAHG